METNIISKFELNEDVGKICGIAVPLEQICGDMRRIAFTEKALESQLNKTVPLFANHNNDIDKIYGKTKFTKLSSEGLHFESQLYMNRNDINNIIEPIKDGVLKGVSIGVSIKNYKKDKKNDTFDVEDCDIKELSLTTNPSFQMAGIREFFEMEENSGFVNSLSLQEGKEKIESFQSEEELFNFLQFGNLKEEELDVIKLIFEKYKELSYFKESNSNCLDKLDKILSNLK